MFRHFLFTIEDPHQMGALGDFDPCRDLLLRRSMFLTWRRWDQLLPERVYIYGAVAPFCPQDGTWPVIQFDTRRTFPGVKRWVAGQGQGKRNQLGKYEHSKHHRLFSIPNSWEELAAKLATVNELYWPFSSTFKPEVIRGPELTELRLTYHVGGGLGNVYVPEWMLPRSDAWGEIRRLVVDRILTNQLTPA